MITYIQPTKTVLRKPPYLGTREEGLYQLYLIWWLEDWKDYILRQNCYLYWAEGGTA